MFLFFQALNIEEEGDYFDEFLDVIDPNPTEYDRLILRQREQKKKK